MPIDGTGITTVQVSTVASESDEVPHSGAALPLLLVAARKDLIVTERFDRSVNELIGSGGN